MGLQLKDYKHPYYCSKNNYYSNEAFQDYDTFSAFLEEWKIVDVDMNLVFRWDIVQNENTKEWILKLFMIQQRKGIYKPIEIGNITEKDLPLIEKRLLPHKEKLLELWKPF